MQERVRGFCLTIALLLVAPAGQAFGETIRMDQDCTAAGYTLNVDCFEDLDALAQWLWMGSTPRDPSSASPVIVDVGEGTFVANTNVWCPSYKSTPLANDPGNPNGHVTFRGVSRERSVLRGATQTGFLFVTHDCDGLEFQDLRIEATETGIYKGIAFNWQGEGSATFTDVDIEAGYTAWYDSSCAELPGSGPVGEHYFWGSKLVSGSLGYYADCGRTWLYGSEILVTPHDGTLLPVLAIGLQAVVGVKSAFRGDVRLFGSAVRVDASNLSSAVPAYGLLVGAGGNGHPMGEGAVHMHGGIVNVNGGSVDRDVYGVFADTFGNTVANPAMAHVIDTAFAVRTTPNGTSTRAGGDGRVQSPFLWQFGSAPPDVGSTGHLQSLSGADLYVETDCDSAGCSGTGTEPHLMIYRADCPNSPWFDVVRGACRD